MRQAVLPEKFTKKQQLQSRLDGGVDLDGSRRQLLETTPQELPGHHVLEHRRAHAEQRPLLSLYSQVSLQGCHQCLMPEYRLPQKTLNITPLDEVGMASDDQRAEAVAAPPREPSGVPEHDDLQAPAAWSPVAVCGSRRAPHRRPVVTAAAASW